MMKNSEIIKKQIDNMLKQLPKLRESEDFSNYRNLVDLMLQMYLDFSNKFYWGIEDTSNIKDLKHGIEYVEKIKLFIEDEIIIIQQKANKFISNEKYSNYIKIIMSLNKLMEIGKYTQNDYSALCKTLNEF